MPYDGDQTWPDLTSSLDQKARQLVQNLLLYNEAYNDWQTFRAGRTDAQIATDLTNLGPQTVTTTMVSEMDSAFSSFKDLHDLANNAAVAQGDRFFSLRKFT